MERGSNETMCLPKRMVQLGLCSYREADSYIEQGWVKINGQTAAFGQKVTERDYINFNRQVHEKQIERATILLNKPVGYVNAQVKKGYKSITELTTADNRWEGDDNRIPFSGKHKFGLAPAGRLDIDSVGLLVSIQDGRIAKRLIGEGSGSEREYLVRVRDKLGEKELTLLNHRLGLDGEKLRSAKVKWQSEDRLRFMLKQNKKRQIRRMCEFVGLRVIGLKRIWMGEARLGKLLPDKWRYLRADRSL